VNHIDLGELHDIADSGSGENTEAVGWEEGPVVYFKLLSRNLTKGQNELAERTRGVVVLFGHHINCILFGVEQQVTPSELLGSCTLSIVRYSRS
jgi:hypothetical protein